MTALHAPRRICCAVATVAALAFGVPPATAAVVVGHEWNPSAATLQAGPLRDKVEQGRQAMAARRYADAERLLLEASRLDPASPVPWLELAENARLQGDAPASRRWLDKATAAAPRDVAVMRAVARWHYAMGEYDEAEKRWRAGLRIDPRHAGVLIDLADFAFNMRNDMEAAGALYREVLAVDGSHAGAHYGLGNVLLRRNDTAGALRHLGRAAELAPGNVLPWMAQAQVHRQRGDRDAALRAYAQVLKLQPGFFQARMDRGELLLGTDPAQALAEFKAVAEAQPKLAAPWAAAGMAQQLLKQPQAALDSYREALKRDPKHLVALNNAAWLASSQPERLADARAWANEAARLAPARPEVIGTLAWVRHLQGESGPALEMLREVVKGPGRELAGSHYLLARVLAAQGDREGAGKAAREALRLDPKFPEAAEANALLRKLQTPRGG